MQRPFTLHLLRHGEVPANAAGLRCGGENNQALNETGQAQIRTLAERLQRAQPDYRPGCIFCGSLRRTRQSATLLLGALGDPPIITCPGLNERLLGDWNGQPVNENAAALDAGMTPPGGESETEFARRIKAALDADVLPQRDRLPLIITSKGVARMIFKLLGGRERLQLDNAELIEVQVRLDHNNIYHAERIRR